SRASTHMLSGATDRIPPAEPIARGAATRSAAARRRTPRRPWRVPCAVTIFASPSVNLFRIPTRMVFGRGVASRVAEPLLEIGAKQVLIVTDRGVRGAKLLDPIEQSLRDAGVRYEIYDEVAPDPGVGEV